MTIEAKLDKTNELLAGILAALTSGKAIDFAKLAKPAPAPQGAATPPATLPATPPGGGTPTPLAYDKDVKPLVLKLMAKDGGKGRATAAEILKKHGVDNASKLKPEQYPAVIKDVQAALA